MLMAADNLEHELARGGAGKGSAIDDSNVDAFMAWAEMMAGKPDGAQA